MTSLNAAVSMQFLLQAAPILIKHILQVGQDVFAGVFLQLDMTTAWQPTKPILNTIQYLSFTQSSNTAVEHIEAEIGGMLANKVQNKTAFFIFMQTQASANLLLEDGCALSRA